MNTYFTSDTHFGHETLLKFYPNGRGRCANADEVDDLMIENWNRKVGPTSTVYHLGDFTMNERRLRSIISRLNGRIILVPGNHDRQILSTPEFREMFADIMPYSYGEIRLNKVQIILSHFPFWEWNKCHRGTFHLHGHLHGKPHNIPGKILDVGVDGNNLTPWSWDEIVEYMSNRPLRSHHGETK